MLSKLNKTKGLPSRENANLKSGCIIEFLGGNIFAKHSVCWPLLLLRTRGPSPSLHKQKDSLPIPGKERLSNCLWPIWIQPCPCCWDCRVIQDSWRGFPTHLMGETSWVPKNPASFQLENHDESSYSATPTYRAILKHHWMHLPFSPHLLLHFKQTSTRHLLASVMGPIYLPELITLQLYAVCVQITKKAQFCFRLPQKIFTGALPAGLMIQAWRLEGDAQFSCLG